MIHIAMSDTEFAVIEKALEHADPEEKIEVHLADPTVPTIGNIIGYKPRKWTADFAFAGHELVIIGHGLFSGIIENRICERLIPALVEMRRDPAA